MSVFRPFKASTWYGIVASVFATSLVIYTMCLMSRHLLGIHEQLSTLTDCLWYTYGALLGQGKGRDARTISVRIKANAPLGAVTSTNPASPLSGSLRAVIDSPRLILFS